MELGLPIDEVLKVTPHAEKVTLIAYGLHAGATTPELLIQGGWKGRDEPMPMKHGRAAGAVSLNMTKKLLTKVAGDWAPPLDIDVPMQFSEMIDLPPVPAPFSFKVKGHLAKKLNQRKAKASEAAAPAAWVP